jgi:hypothetical protein
MGMPSYEADIQERALDNQIAIGAFPLNSSVGISDFPSMRGTLDCQQLPIELLSPISLKLLWMIGR